MNGGAPMVDVDELRRLAATRASQKEIAARLGVGQPAISALIRKHNMRPWHKRHGKYFKEEAQWRDR